MTSINSQEDFLRALSENEQWREAVRGRILGDELLQLPVKIDAHMQRMDGFIAEQQALNAKLDGTIEELKQANARTDSRLDRFIEEQRERNARLDRFIEEQRETNARLGRLIEEQQETNARLQRRFDRMTDDVGFLKGQYVLGVARSHSAAVADELNLKLVRNLDNEEIVRMSREARGIGIPTNHLLSFSRADLVIEATDGENTHYIAVEASFTGDWRDTSRAKRNAGFMTRFTGCPAHAVVASVRNDRDIEAEFRSRQVYWFEVEDRFSSQREE